MTVIIGLKQDGKVYMGGDRAVGFYNTRLTLGQSKIINWGDMLLIGIAGGARIWQLLEYEFGTQHFIQMSDCFNPNAGIVFFLKRLIDVLKASDMIQVVEGTPQMNSTLLLGWKGELYIIDGSLGMHRVADNYAAIGVADEIALGAMAALEGSRLGPEKKLTKALGICARFSKGVSGPFDIAAID